MPVILANKKLIPAPLATFNLPVRRTEDGTKRGMAWNITLNGKLALYKGSPNASGEFWTSSGYPSDDVVSQDSRLAAARAKMGAQAALATIDGQLLEIQPFDGSQSIQARVRLQNISFAEGLWTEYVPYTIQFEADKMVFGDVEVGGYTAASNPPEESWGLEPADEYGRTYKLTHTCTSSAKNRFNTSGGIEAYGWEIARDIITGGPLAGGGATTALGIDTARVQSTGVIGLFNHSAYNYSRVEQVDEANGKVSVSENWLLYNPNDSYVDYGSGIAAIEDFTVEARVGEDGRTRATINGTIRGLEVRDNTTFALTSTRYANAVAKWAAVRPNLAVRTNTYVGTGVVLNTTYLQLVAGINPVAGTITYSSEYNNRNNPLITNAISENLTVTYDRAADVVAQIGVLNRPAGPVLQDIGSTTAKVKTISLEAILPSSTTAGDSTEPDTDALIAGYAPTGTYVFVQRDQISWSISSGRYSRNTAWLYQ